jgi:3-alpha domain
VSPASSTVPVSEITRLYVAKRWDANDVASVQRAMRVDALPGSWKAYFRERFAKAKV